MSIIIDTLHARSGVKNKERAAEETAVVDIVLKSFDLCCMCKNILDRFIKLAKGNLS